MDGKDKKYQIVTNVNRRKILVINDVVEVDRTPGLSVRGLRCNVYQRDVAADEPQHAGHTSGSPLQSEKCRFKPCYVTRRLSGWLGKAEVIVDGYASSPTDHNVAQGIEDIYANMRHLNFLLGTEPVVTHAEEVLSSAAMPSRADSSHSRLNPRPGLTQVTWPCTTIRYGTKSRNTC